MYDLQKHSMPRTQGIHTTHHTHTHTHTHTCAPHSHIADMHTYAPHASHTTTQPSFPGDDESMNHGHTHKCLLCCVSYEVRVLS